MTDYEVVIGLEIHVQLCTRTKLFCGCEVDPAAAANSRTDPICLGLPGVLPVLNATAVDLAARLAWSLGCDVAGRSEFARKHYFYPDLPKNYQITQYEFPLARGGSIEFEVEGKRKHVRLERMHMEEDAGRLVHDARSKRSQVDFNRVGSPLVEVVTLPEIESPSDASAVVSHLQELARWIAVSDANMELGQLRCDANLSLRPRGSDVLGQKVEIKNLNSTRNVVEALRFEHERQAGVLDAGRPVLAQTRGYDPDRGVTFVMREKEELADYRYFPEPDLPPLVIVPERMQRLRASAEAIGSPLRLRERYRSELGLADEAARVVTTTRSRVEFFEAAVSSGATEQRVADWIRGDLLRLSREKGSEDVELLGISPAQLAGLCRAIEAGDLSHHEARQRVEQADAGLRAWSELAVREQGLSSAELEKLVAEVIEAHPDQVARYREGKISLLGWFIGQIRRACDSPLDPGKLAEEIRRQLEGNPCED